VGSGDDGVLLRRTSSSKKTTGSFAAGSSTSSQPSIEVSGGRRWCVMVAARLLGLDVLPNKIRSIHATIYRGACKES
jgi:hypothetical protein